ncbi:uncharacterized protein I303_108175 [Kwoniella dejecticola CBS 10117]|uniref:PCI domain-containing protein n=1 Tax=Kwoniella dejecticola CBS 10117 TaxID=1296121 RepID=A0A1A5ZY41_9TREE|nr:uncharacterized protein I303_07499 [Kwoniella dejecticola CBS 10117]OBR82732.1 hypothetical protein I303_07499 [Kwoniella dejecticola CBS 10117]
MVQASSSSSSSGRRSVEDAIAAVDLSTFDWKAYEGTYTGRALITRLIHIPNTLLSPPAKPTTQSINLAKEALKRLIPHIKNETLDYHTYIQCVNLLKDPASRQKIEEDRMEVDESAENDAHESSSMNASTSAGANQVESNGVMDKVWVDDAKEHERRENSKLSVELTGYLSNLIKESIRLTYLAYAQLSIKVGDSQAAMKNYAAVREYSTSQQHHVDLGVGIVETLLAFNQPQALPGHISKLEATLDRLHPPITTSKFQAEAASVTASDIRERREAEARSQAVRRTVMVRIRVGKGLVTLYNKEWSKAARELGAVGEVEGGLGDFEGKAISSSDLALIIAFTTLASSHREKIRRVLLEQTSFKAQVDDGSSWIMDLVRSFVDAKYGEVMRLLYRSEPTLLLNPFLSAHAQTLLELIQTRCILQYVQPFSTIHIPLMANSFGLAPGEMLGLVEILVERREIKGKIDLIDQVLVMKDPDYRGGMFTNALKVGKKASDVTQSAILRMKMVEAGLIVDPRPPKNEKTGTGTGAGIDEKGQLTLDEGLGDGLDIEPISFEA